MPVFALTDELIFPPVRYAEPNGLLAVGGDLSVDRLLLAYSLGIFPWYARDEPILWWSPNPRLVLLPHELHVSRSLHRFIKKGLFTVSFDTAFAKIITHCADMRGPGRTGTWITEEMRSAYRDLHASGYAHSVETWHGDRLVGGLYGVALNGCFFGESMFSLADNASKVALVALVEYLKAHDFAMIDCQMRTEHLVRLGAREVSRRVFLDMIAKGQSIPVPQGKWTE